MDIFSFIPVPKDDSVSTKQSLIGTAVFFIIFLTYIIYDFVQFVNSNPPIIQSYRTQLDDSYYTLPRFAYAFMYGNLTDQTQVFDDLFTTNLTQTIKTQGGEAPSLVSWDFVTYNSTTGVSSNFDLIPWMSDATKQFYSILRTPTQDLVARGLLYSSDVTQYIQYKFYFCTNYTNPNITCMDDNTIADYASHGRIFLFV